MWELGDVGNDEGSAGGGGGGGSKGTMCESEDLEPDPKALGEKGRITELKAGRAGPPHPVPAS